MFVRNGDGALYESYCKNNDTDDDVLCLAGLTGRHDILVNLLVKIGHMLYWDIEPTNIQLAGGGRAEVPSTFSSELRDFEKPELEVIQLQESGIGVEISN